VLTTVQLFTLQIALGFGATPVLGQGFSQLLPLLSPSSPPELGTALGAVVSQAALLWISGGILSQARERSNAELAELGLPQVAPTSQYRWDVPSVVFAAAVSAAALGAGLLLNTAQAPDMHVRSAEEMAVLVRGGSWATIAATGAATAVLAPLLEERIYRGFVLGSLLSPICHLRVNVHLAVRCVWLQCKLLCWGLVAAH